MTSRNVSVLLIGVPSFVLVVGLHRMATPHVPVAAAPAPMRPPATFFAEDSGLVFLGPDGHEKQRLAPGATNGALSPDGRWIACCEFDKDLNRSRLVIRPRGGTGDPVTIPLLWGTAGTSGSLPVWSADGHRILIGESRPGQCAFRVYEFATKQLTELKLPEGHWVTGWSPDGKRFLTTASTKDGNARIAWVKGDGTGEPEFLTSAEEIAYHARLSPGGRHILYQGGPKPAKGKRVRVRLYVMDLASKQRTPVDEPGETHGHCWSPDGTRVAYTWQRSLDDPAKMPERETLLITCDPDGRNRQTVARRKYSAPEESSGRSSVVYFFTVLDWR